ncbi:MAG: J domain-containing protein [Chloroflexota bacterium]|nr:J domain-containing protein [Chloroflexota bacterium]
MKQFVLDYLTNETAKLDGVRAYTPVGHDADLHIKLKNGKQIAVYVINRALRLPEIREKYEANAHHRLHTLFIVDQRLLPPHGAQTEAAYWISALHSLAHGRIYAYTCDRRDVSILPMHIDWKWGAETRTFEYGPPVHVGGLRADMLESNSKYIIGTFAVATFGEPAFWQKRQPIDEGRGKKYSWRNTSFRNEKKRAQQEPQYEFDWDSWEEFQAQYGKVGQDDEFHFDWESAFRDAGSVGNSGYKVVDSSPYTLLGVNVGATLDEVKSAYRRKARENHPDLHPPARRQEYTAKMIEINAAFEAIKKRLEKS